MPDEHIPAKTYITEQIKILNKLRGKSFYRKHMLAARAQTILSKEDRLLSQQVMQNYKKMFKKAPAEKAQEREVFKYRYGIFLEYLNFRKMFVF